MGGTLATLRLHPRPGREDELRRRLAATALPDLLEQPQLSGVHLCEAAPEAGRIETAERRLRESVVKLKETVSNQRREIKELRELVTRLSLAAAVLTDQQSQPAPRSQGADNVVAFRPSEE